MNKPKLQIVPNDLERAAQWMIANGIATGHGDTIEALLIELIGHCSDRARAVTAARYGEKSEDWQQGFDRGGNAAADRVLEIIHPQQPSAAQ